MEKITVAELQRRTGKTLATLANEIGCCVALLSKINHRKEPITDEMQEKFQHAYPYYILDGGKERWKDAYLEQVEINRLKEDRILELEMRCAELERKIKKITKILEG